MEVWTRTMAGITLVIIAPPHTQPTQKSEEKMNQNTKPNKVLIWLWDKFSFYGNPRDSTTVQTVEKS